MNNDQIEMESKIKDLNFVQENANKDGNVDLLEFDYLWIAAFYTNNFQSDPLQHFLYITEINKNYFEICIGNLDGNILQHTLITQYEFEHFLKTNNIKIDKTLIRKMN